MTNSRFLLYEAQQAYVYGLPENLALAAVTSTPAEAMGMGHRIGYIKEGTLLHLTMCGPNFMTRDRLGRWQGIQCLAKPCCSHEIV